MSGGPAIERAFETVTYNVHITLTRREWDAIQAECSVLGETGAVYISEKLRDLAQFLITHPVKEPLPEPPPPEEQGE